VGNECYKWGPVFIPLNLYPRHFRAPGKCLGGYQPDFRNYEYDELRRGWKRCHCPIYADGTLGGEFKRKNTRQTTWPEAKAVANVWEAAGRWQDDILTTAAVQPVADSTAIASQGITLERAVTAFLAERAESSAPNTKEVRHPHEEAYGALRRKRLTS
jgi:hypothetical protein